MKKKKTLSKKFRIFRILCLIGYIGSAGVLIAESCMDGASSANQSNTVGGTIAGIVNDIGGDQTVVVEPTSLSITNKIDTAHVGDQYTLIAKTEPTDATYQAINYSSSDTSIASISDDGIIKFLRAGEVTFEVINTRYTDIKDSMTVKVQNVEVKKITSIIYGAEPDDEDIYTLNIGEDYSISTYFSPTNATIINSLSYSVDNPEYLSVNNYGKITPLKHSFEEISTIKINYDEVFTELKVKVKSSSVVDLNSIEVDSKIELYPTEVKNVNVTLNPENATFYNYTITSSDTSIVRVSNNRLVGVTPGNAKVSIIPTYYPNLRRDIEVIVKPYEPVQDFTISLSGSSEFYFDETRTISITTLPEFSKPISVEYSYNPNIVSINNGIITPTRTQSGTTTINVIVDGKTESARSIEIKVLPLNEITTFNATINGSTNIGMLVGQSKNIFISVPKHSVNYKATYSSLNSNIASVDNSGKVTALNVGDTIIDVTIGVKTKQINIKVQTPEEMHVKDINIKIKDNYKLEIDGNEYIKIDCTNTENNLSDLIDISFLPSNPTNENEKTISYEIEEESELQFDGSKISTSIPGIYSIKAIHNYTGITKKLNIFAYYPFGLNIKDRANSLDLIVGQSFEFEITDKQTEDIQDYKIELNNDNLVLLDLNSKRYQVTSNGSVNDGTIKVIPIINNQEYSQLAQEIKINFNHIYATYTEIVVHDNEKNVNIDVTNKSLTMVRGDSLSVSAFIDNNVTIQSIHFTSSDEEILTIDNSGLLIPHKCGNVRVTLKEEFSNLSDYLDITIYNKIALVEDNNFQFKGPRISYDESNDTYVLTNGFSAKLSVFFTEDSTFTQVIYQSSDEKVVSADKDGTITPNKVGNATITLIIDDGMQDEIRIDIKVKIIRQDMIDDLSNFFYKVRKSLGHFGAFLVFGICSTLTLLLYFDELKWLFSVPLNFIQGFGLAALTEFIQTKVPGRYGCLNDVLIDFSGFMISALVITFGIIGTYVVKLLIKKHKNKKQAALEESNTELVINNDEISQDSSKESEDTTSSSIEEEPKDQ